MLKLEELGVNEPLDEAGAMFSDFDPAALGCSRQHLDSVAGQSCRGDLLLRAGLFMNVNVGIVKGPIQ
jgi:hypothetical protein